MANPYTEQAHKRAREEREMRNKKTRAKRLSQRKTGVGFTDASHPPLYQR